MGEQNYLWSHFPREKDSKKPQPQHEQDLSHHHRPGPAGLPHCSCQRGGGRTRKKTRKGRGKQRQGTITAVCFEQSLTIMKMREGVVANFLKQKNRMEKQNETAGKKFDKRSSFGPIGEMLVSAGGGNRSAPSCGGNTTNDGAKQLANLTTTLDSCM